MMNMSSSSYSVSVSSSYSRAPQQQPRKQAPVQPMFVCNRCRKPLTATVFVCNCDCLFCEDCTYAHFHENSNCPVCRKTLCADDFLELCIAEPSLSAKDFTKHAFQMVLTKLSRTNKSLSHQEACSRAMSHLEDHRRIARFVMKQMLFSNNQQQHASGNMDRAYGTLKLEYTKLQQSSNSARISYEEKLAEFERRLQASKGTVEDLQKKLGEKDQHIMQLKNRYAHNEVPSSGYSRSSGGGMRGRPSGSSASLPSPHHHTDGNGPPMPAYLMQKQQHDREQQAPPRVPFAGVRSNDSVITPIHAPSSHHGRYAPPPSASGHPPAMPTPRASGYVFTSGTRHHVPRSSQVGYAPPSSAAGRYGGHHGYAPR